MMGKYVRRRRDRTCLSSSPSKELSCFAREDLLCGEGEKESGNLKNKSVMKNKKGSESNMLCVQVLQKPQQFFIHGVNPSKFFS